MIDIPPRHLAMVHSILNREAGPFDIWAFGSRVNGTSRKFSDLDLAIVALEPVPLEILGKIKEAFVESDLPMSVDIVDLQNVEEEFRSRVEKKHVVLKTASDQKSLNE